MEGFVPFLLKDGKYFTNKSTALPTVLLDMELQKPSVDRRTDVFDQRTPQYEIAPLFVNRWSPRAMTGELLDEGDFMPLFEAARWAPSAYNEQPWRFCYATPEHDGLDAYVSLLSPGNQEWASHASVLVVIVSKTVLDHDGSTSRTHSFDTGAAWISLALEASRRGLVAHGIGGFDHERAAEVLSIPADHAVEAMAAIGVHGQSPDQTVEGPEHETPSERDPLSEIVIDGTFTDGQPEDGDSL